MFNARVEGHIPVAEVPPSVPGSRGKATQSRDVGPNIISCQLCQNPEEEDSPLRFKAFISAVLISQEFVWSCDKKTV